jgi:hypothetical protein
VGLSILEKRYQVFVSSTYADLQEERQEVMQALLELDCIPAGMELFPAANEDQWSLIKKVIDDCDYYIVIVAGRYGSLGPSGQSFTEMEYRYAVESNKPVIGFLHKNPGDLPASRCEKTEDGKTKLAAFIDLTKHKMCRFWESPADLGSQVSRSLVKLIKNSPAIGWVRADLVPDQSAAEEILTLKKQIEKLEQTLQDARTTAPAGAERLEQGDDKVSLIYSFVASTDRWEHNGTRYNNAKVEISWNLIFSTVSPRMIDEASDNQFRSAIVALVEHVGSRELRTDKELKDKTLVGFKIADSSFDKIKVQLRALGLIKRSEKNRSVKDTQTYWTLTPYGDNAMTRLIAIHRIVE